MSLNTIKVINYLEVVDLITEVDHLRFFNTTLILTFKRIKTDSLKGYYRKLRKIQRPHNIISVLSLLLMILCDIGTILTYTRK